MASFPSEEEDCNCFDPSYFITSAFPSFKQEVSDDKSSPESLTSPSHEEKDDSIAKSCSSEMLMNSDWSWDNFRLRRDCFRGFSDYFKKKFKPLGDIWQGGKRNKVKKVQMRPLVEQFLRQELEMNEVSHLITPMIVVLHSHRYNKGEDFAQNIDFSIIWNLIQSYSQEAREIFMQDSAMALFFNHFCVRGKSSFLSKSQGKS